MQRVLAFAPIPALFLAGAAIARFLLRHAPARIAPDRAQPLLVVTAWDAYGTLAFALLAATFALATTALFIALARAGPLEGRALVTLCAATLCACALWPFVFSSDVYAYAAYGDLAARGLSPYALAPAALHDPLLDAARWQWGGVRFPPCVYGPAFVVFARGLIAAASAFAFAPAATLATFRICAMLAYLATLIVANAALHALPNARRARIVTLAALNPIVLWSVAEGHNDIYAVLAIAIVAAVAGRLGASATGTATFAFLPLALLVKASAAILAFAFVLEAVLVRGRRAVPVIAASLGGLAVTAAIGLPPLLPALHALAAHGRYQPSVSLAHFTGPIVAIVLGVSFVAVACIALVRGRRSGYAWLGLAAVAVLPNPYPWYAVALVPLALADERARASRALYAVTICGAVRYLPDAYGNMSPGAAAIASIVQVIPIAFALSGLTADLAPRDNGRPSPTKRIHPT